MRDRPDPGEQLDRVAALSEPVRRRLYELVRQETGAPLPRELPPFAVRLVGRFEELRAGITGRMPQVTPATVSIFEHDWALDSSEAAAHLNYRITPLVKGVQAVLATMAR